MSARPPPYARRAESGSALQIKWARQTFTVLPQRALLWHETSSLFIADPHFGKDAAFRAIGLPVPGSCTPATVTRLAVLVSALQPARLIILGDFLHARCGRTTAVWDALLAWRRTCRDLRITLVRGNHDRAAGDPIPELDIDCVQEGWRAGPLALRHAPRDDLRQESSDARDGAFAMYGHVHPAVSFEDGCGRLQLPCLLIRGPVAVLPAFGHFTGCCALRPASTDRVFVMTDGEVIDVSPRRSP